MSALAMFGVGFAVADTMVTKVIPDVFGVRSDRRDHGRADAGVA